MGLLVLRHQIIINQKNKAGQTGRNKKLFIPFLTECSVQNSYDNFTKTAKFILPRNLKFNNENIYFGENPLLQKGDEVIIKMDYQPKFDKDKVISILNPPPIVINEVFKGYISNIGSGVPVEIKCEDEMWLLKQKTSPNINHKSVTLRALLTEMLGASYPFKCIDADLGEVRIQGASFGLVFDKLRSDYGLFSFFKDGFLRVGLPYYAPKKEATFLFEKNIINSELEYLKSDDVKIKVKGIIVGETTRTEILCFYKDNVVTFLTTTLDGVSQKVNESDIEGDLRTFFQYGGTITELKRKCEAYLKENSYEGFRGSFETFLEPAVEVGDLAIIASLVNKETKGTYLIKSVEKTTGVDGARQNIELQRKLA